MRYRAIAIVVAVAGCGGGGAARPSIRNEAQRSSARTCPRPADPDVVARFAVGTTPEHRVSALFGEAPRCYDEFTGDVIVLDAGAPRLIREGMFEGRCHGDSLPRTFESVAAAAIVVETVGTHVGLGELGAGRPVLLAMAHPEWTVSLAAHPIDECGERLELGASHDVTAWRLGDGCAGTVEIVAAITSVGHSEEVELAALGAGVCTVDVRQLGFEARVTVTVE